jgi:hypothetical protein
MHERFPVAGGTSRFPQAPSTERFPVAGGTSRFPHTPSTGPLRGQAAFAAEGRR